MLSFLSSRKDKNEPQKSVQDNKLIIGRDGSVRLNIENQQVQQNILQAVQEARKFEQSKTQRKLLPHQ